MSVLDSIRRNIIRMTDSMPEQLRSVPLEVSVVMGLLMVFTELALMGMTDRNDTDRFATGCG